MRQLSGNSLVKSPDITPEVIEEQIVDLDNIDFVTNEQLDEYFTMKFTITILV